LKFTDAFSHLLARRLVSRFAQQKDYLRVAPLLAMESLGCEEVDLDAELAKILGRQYKKPSFNEGMSPMDPRTANSRSLRLYTVGRLLGIEPDEWTLNFNRPLDPEFPTGVQGAYGQDNSVARLVQSLLLERLAADVSGLKGNFKLSRGVSEFFKGQNFACVDDLGGALEFDSIEKQKLMCSALLKAQKEKVGEKIQVLAKETSLIDGSPQVSLKKVNAALREDFKNSPAGLVAKGSNVAQMYCAACHGATSYLPAHYHFLTTPAAFKKAAAQDPLLLLRVMAYTESARMPMGQTLATEDRKALQLYLFKTAGDAR
jgi:mono/diheme cytochrome c family protein